MHSNQLKQPFRINVSKLLKSFLVVLFEPKFFSSDVSLFCAFGQENVILVYLQRCLRHNVPVCMIICLAVTSHDLMKRASVMLRLISMDIQSYTYLASQTY